MFVDHLDLQRFAIGGRGVVCADTVANSILLLSGTKTKYLVSGNRPRDVTGVCC